MTGKVVWDERGQAFWAWYEFVPCPSPYHFKSYDDEYGTYHTCNACRGTGKIIRQCKRRVSQWDAPRPPVDWTPRDAIEDFLAKIYGVTDD